MGIFRKILPFCVIPLCIVTAAGNILQNEDFSSGLSGWIVDGAVFPGLGEAAMTDENVARSFLYQGVELAPGTYRLNIDFRSLLSTEEPLGFARDTFFASIYLSSTPELFNPRQPAGFDSFLSLFDFDAAGPYDFSGNFSINPMRTDYLIYSQNISLAETATLFTVFELTDLNGINDNSLVLVDSVVILIPEPESALLAGLVALIFLLIHRRRHP